MIVAAQDALHHGASLRTNYQNDDGTQRDSWLGLGRSFKVGERCEIDDDDKVWNFALDLPSNFHFSVIVSPTTVMSFCLAPHSRAQAVGEFELEWWHSLGQRSSVMAAGSVSD